jgi:membrane-bound hydrogenase subunit beta
MGETKDSNIELPERLKNSIPQEWILSLKAPEPRRIFLSVRREHFKEVMTKVLEDEGITHLSTITGVDLGEEIEVIYHLDRSGIILSVKTTAPKDQPILPTVTDLIPGATLYEREVHELLGVMFEGHPNLSRLVLPEGWPPGLYPLRKEVSIEKIRSELEKAKEEK